MKLFKSKRTESRFARLGVEELELRSQPAAFGVGLSVAALHVPDVLPATSALIRNGLVGDGAGVATPSTGVTQSPNSGSQGDLNGTQVVVTKTSTPPVVVSVTMVFGLNGQHKGVESSPSDGQGGSSQGGSKTPTTTTPPPTTSTPSNPVTVVTIAFSFTVTPAVTSLSSSAATAPAVSNVSTLSSVGASVFAATSATSGLGFGAPTTDTTRSVTSETRPVRLSDLNADAGATSTAPVPTQSLTQLPWLWAALPAESAIEDGATITPDQPVPDAKKGPDADQPANPVEKDMGSSEASAPASDDARHSAIENVVAVPVENVVVPAPVAAPVAEDEATSNQTWIASAASLLAAAGGYWLVRWHRMYKRSREALLARVARI
jgi:hypothetical protein